MFLFSDFFCVHDIISCQIWADWSLSDANEILSFHSGLNDSNSIVLNVFVCEMLGLKLKVCDQSPKTPRCPAGF